MSAKRDRYATERNAVACFRHRFPDLAISCLLTSPQSADLFCLPREVDKIRVVSVENISSKSDLDEYYRYYADCIRIEVKASNCTEKRFYSTSNALGGKHSFYVIVEHADVLLYCQAEDESQQQFSFYPVQLRYASPSETRAKLSKFSIFQEEKSSVRLQEVVENVGTSNEEVVLELMHEIFKIEPESEKTRQALVVKEVNNIKAQVRKHAAEINSLRLRYTILRTGREGSRRLIRWNC